MNFINKIRNKIFMSEFNKLKKLLYENDDEYRKDFVRKKLPKQINKLESLIELVEEIYQEKEKIGGYNVIGLYDDIDTKFYTPENELQDIKTVDALYTVDKETRHKLDTQHIIASTKIEQLKKQIDEIVDEINNIVIYYDLYIKLSPTYYYSICRDKWNIYILTK